MENKENVYGPGEDNYGRDKKPWDKTPTAVDEMDLEGVAEKFGREYYSKDKPANTYTFHEGFKSGYNYCAQTQQSKVVEVIEAMKRHPTDHPLNRSYNQALTDLLTKLKQ